MPPFPAAARLTFLVRGDPAASIRLRKPVRRIGKRKATGRCRRVPDGGNGAVFPCERRRHGIAPARGRFLALPSIQEGGRTMSRVVHSAYGSTLEAKDLSEAGRQPGAESRPGPERKRLGPTLRWVLGPAIMAALLSTAAPVSATTGRAGVVVPMKRVTIIGQHGLSRSEVEGLHALMMMIEVGIMVPITVFDDFSANELVSVVAPTPVPTQECPVRRIRRPRTRTLTTCDGPQQRRSLVRRLGGLL
jgi:hypothetical protein